MKKIVYFDMDNTLVDFGSGIDRLPPALRAEYEHPKPHYDDVPGIFGLMDPLPGAVAAVHELRELFDLYVLSTSPWDNPTAWHDKVAWVRRYFGEALGTPLYKRVILSHHKHLNRGDFLVDDRPWKNGADRFDGAVIHFGREAAEREWPANVVAHLDTWPDVVAFLKDQA